MRQSFIIGAIMLWVAINILGNIADSQALLEQVDTKVTDDKHPSGMTQKQLLEVLGEQETTDVSDTTIFTKIGSFFVLLGKTLTLWHPALWQGSAMYLYFFLFLPIGISFWVVFLMAIRGVGSS